MPTITFLPRNVSIEMPGSAPLLEAARLAGVFVQTPCGGKGTCGKCRCQVSGPVDFDNAKGLDLPQGEVLICMTKIRDADVAVTLPEEKVEIGKFDGSVDVKPYMPDELDGYVKIAEIQVAAPAMLDGLSDLDRFRRAFRAWLLQNKQKIDSVDVPLSALRDLPEKLRQNEGHLTVFYALEKNENAARIISVEAITAVAAETDRAASDIGDKPRFYGAAVDIGTTTVALWLTDLATGEILFSRTSYNGQIDCGLDVISRINYAHKYLPELTKRILGTINSLLDLSRVDLSHVMSFSLTGNTTMIHLLLGVVAEYIRLSPYTPAVMAPPVYTASQIGLYGCPEAPVLMAPAVGSYVGGDITAGALCTSLAQESDDTILFIDIGTNGELLLGSQEFLFGCACSAGPAFEGGGIRHGMRASAGAIEKVAIDASGKAIISTIENAPPVGLCGSGVISLVAELFRTGLIDMAGRFMDGCSYVKRVGRVAEYQVCENVVLTEVDIDNFIRAKAAIFSACQTLIESVGLAFGDIDRFYVAGGFGRFL
ncbi:MAG: ASKHA domain-containing protein, partial [Clostridiales bacterium]|nr:ASKHA domain-containing protein [Clostridiales bacterium]